MTMLRPEPTSEQQATARPPVSSGDPLAGFSLTDVEAMRLLLRGTSIIDWHRLSFSDRQEVDRFLRLNEFEPEDGEDLQRLEDLRAEAVDYLTRHFDYRIPDEVASDAPVPELLMLASHKGRHQLYACMVLKVMHVMHHLDGREILFRLPVSDDQVFGLVENKVVDVVEQLRGAGYPIMEFSWSRKERDSLITKLLAKRDSIAAHVYDKLRFRLVMRRRADLPGVLREILHRLIPFNYIIPGETVNKILSFRKLVEGSDTFRRYSEHLQADNDLDNVELAVKNEFSASDYRVINFVADLPIRVSAVMRHVGEARLAGLDINPRAVIFVLTEFQVIDAETAQENEQGESSHTAYKERQHIMVKARLTRGMKQHAARSSR